MGKKGRSEEPRIVFGNREHPNYPSNRVNTQKYSVITFLPKLLLQQFSRNLNRYFLLVACLQIWDEVTPVNPISTWGPLIFVLAIAGVREALDDIGRRRSDKELNHKTCMVWRGGSLCEVTAEHIFVGDMLELRNNEQIPCDCVLIATSEGGECMVQTTNLDGETDLKPRTSPELTVGMEKEEAANFQGCIKCPAPNGDLRRFDSLLSLNSLDVDQDEMFEDEACPLSTSNLLLQGCTVRNTSWALAVVVYTGDETKVGMNHVVPPTKVTRTDLKVDKMAISVFGIQMVVVLALGLAGEFWRVDYRDDAWYLGYEGDEKDYQAIIIPLRFFLLCTVVIPISVKVTIDVCKYYYARVIGWDVHMIDNEGEPALANDTGMSEELGQVGHVLTDKTGTLTENVMVFKQCSIGGILYGGSAVESIFEDDRLKKAIANRDRTVCRTLEALTLCNTVTPATDENGELELKTSSPDEEALVRAAMEWDYHLHSRNQKAVVANICGKTSKYAIESVLEFSSDRKRMSIILKDDAGVLHLFCKGADNMVIPLLSSDPETMRILDKTKEHINELALLGLRTLVIAHRTVSAQELKVYMERLRKAQMDMEQRDKLTEEAYASVEANMQLLGATAIEDRLQDGVPESIQLLRESGIVFWVLTGDKRRTAKQIALSSNLATGHYEDMVDIEGLNDESAKKSLQKCAKVVASRAERVEEIVIVIEGETLAVVMQSPALKQVFSEVTENADSVICCRVTPAQKAEVVSLVKETRNRITLAIGDGGNDVNMIQEADVGVGIRGREGLQAARSADYTFGRFRFLPRLLLVHGHYSLYRTSQIAQYSFYKSIYFGVAQLLYNAFTALSGQTMINSYGLFGYNSVFTGVAVFLYAYDQPLPPEVLMRHPGLYKRICQPAEYFTLKTALYWCIRGVVQAVFIVLMCVHMSGGHITSPDPNIIGKESFGMVVLTVMILLAMLTITQSYKLITRYHIYVLSFQFLFFFITYIFYSLVKQLDFFGVWTKVISDVTFWFTIIFVPIAAHLPFVTFEAFTFNWRPNVLQTLLLGSLEAKERESVESNSDTESEPSFRSWSRSSSLV